MRKKSFCHFCGTSLSLKFVEDRERLFCERCSEPIYENPVPATAVVVVDQTGNLVLVKRGVDPKKGYWCLPGGFMEIGETPEQGALRELKEETGLSGKIDRLLGVTAAASDLYNTVLMVGYLVHEYSGRLIGGGDATEVAYFHPDKLPEIAFKSHRDFIRIYYSAYAYPGAEKSHLS